MWKKSLLILPALILFVGCAGVGSNLSAQRQVRNKENLYQVEVEFDSRQQSLRWESIKAYVIVGKETYEMRKIHMMNNRWEALIPIPANVNTVAYHYKFDYLYNDFGGPKQGSASTRTYPLEIVEQP